MGLVWHQSASEDSGLGPFAPGENWKFLELYICSPRGDHVCRPCCVAACCGRSPGLGCTITPKKVPNNCCKRPEDSPQEGVSYYIEQHALNRTKQKKNTVRLLVSVPRSNEQCCASPVSQWVEDSTICKFYMRRRSLQRRRRSKRSEMAWNRHLPKQAGELKRQPSRLFRCSFACLPQSALL